jgi:hypothetical protein
VLPKPTTTSQLTSLFLWQAQEAAGALCAPIGRQQGTSTTKPQALWYRLCRQHSKQHPRWAPGKLYLDNTSGTYQNNTHNVAGKPQHTQLQQTVIKNYKAQALADAW